MRLRYLPPLVSILLVVAGCQGGGAELERAVTGAGDVKSETVKVPSRLLGLEVRPEKLTGEVSKTKRPYVDRVALFSLRENDLVRATLQIAFFNRLADPASAEFRSSIVDQVGSTRPLTTRMAEQVVHVTTGTEQSIFVWFTKDRFMILTTHRDYEFPRTLLRRSVELGNSI